MKNNGSSEAFEVRPPEARFSHIEPANGGTSTHPQRREHARYRVDLDVSLGSDHNFYAGLVENISVGGVFVATHLLKPVGEKMELAIHLPDSEDVLRGLGEVRWIREYVERSELPPGMGIRFLDLPQESLERIEKFLSKREPLFYDEE
ncbi:MAG: TIGR02266 family protein [Polyangiaceae bacterium]|nr:TIGR02266 family protein [Polyangiaceae bacterium]